MRETESVAKRVFVLHSIQSPQDCASVPLSLLAFSREDLVGELPQECLSGVCIRLVIINRRHFSFRHPIMNLDPPSTFDLVAEVELAFLKVQPGFSGIA